MNCCLIPLLIVAIGAGTEGTTLNDVVVGNNQFALALYRKTNLQPGNLFFSPYSISTALGMTYTGARGETALEMAATLHFVADRERLNAGFAGLTDQIFGGNTRNLYQLDLANALWGQSGLDYQPDFLKQTEASFKATLHPLDFASNPEGSRKTINQWVEQHTHEKIRNLLGPSTIDRNTDLILTNAIYLKAAWLKPFPKLATSNQDFSTATGKVSVPMMSHSSEYRYLDSADDQVQVVDLPYLGGELSMVVILPRQTDGLTRLEAGLTAAKLSRWVEQLGPAETVHVFLPRFKLEQSFELADTLKGMGMARAFSKEADFSGITTSRRLSLSNVIHKAFVDVNEEGTEAAAATAVVMSRTSVMLRPKPPVVFRADHPFLFLIRDQRSGSILFLGRVVNPQG